MYQLRPVAPELRPWVEHYWFVTPDGNAPVELRVDVFVDARADLIFNLGAPYVREIIGGRRVKHAKSNLDAQRLVPIRIVQHGLVRTTGVRFHLGGLGAFGLRALRRWTDRTPSPSSVFGAGAAKLERDLARTKDLDRQAKLLDAFFLERLAVGGSFATFRRALDALVRSDGTATVEAVAAEAGLGVRHLERAFAEHLGIAPKTTARVLRFQRALRMLMRDPGCTLADVAATAGYFDQAHFVRDFKRMTGGVPRGYRGYYPPEGPADFAPNVVVFVQDAKTRRSRG